MSDPEDTVIELQEQPEYVPPSSDVGFGANSAEIDVVEKKRPLEEQFEKLPAASATSKLSYHPAYMSKVDSTTSKNKRMKSEKNERKWMEMFEALKAYQHKHGHCLVPNYFPENEKLGVWVKTQRYQHRLLCEGKPAKISDERVEFLNSIGFVWNVHEMIEEEHKREWIRNLEHVKLFKEEHSHCKIPSKYPPAPHLASWMARQRAHYRLMQSGLQSSMTAMQAKMFEYVVYDIGDGECFKSVVDNGIAAAAAAVAAVTSNVVGTVCTSEVAMTPNVLLTGPLDAEAARLLEESVATAATCAAASLLEFADTTVSSTSLNLRADENPNVNIDDVNSKESNISHMSCNGVTHSLDIDLDAAQVSLGVDSTKTSNINGNNFIGV